MDIMFRHGAELNIKWPVTISLFLHVLLLVTLLSYNTFTRTSTLNSMHTPFSAVQVNIVDFPAEGSSNTITEKVVGNKQLAVSTRKSETISQKQEVRNQKQEVRSKKTEIGNHKEDTVRNSSAIKVSDARKQGSEAVNKGSVLKTAPAADTVPASSVSSAGSGSANAGGGRQEARLTSPFSGTAGPAVDGADFKYDYYLGLIRNKVDSRWNQPVIYSQIKKAVVEFTILRNGKIDSIKISETSGDYYFDQTAVRAVSVSNPFPPLPKGYKENSLRVRYKFIFGNNG
ncbi:MAG: energy transducer TonB [Nitrospira sp.]|nr:energy transducer TonB [Nitrospira sp.]